MNVKVRESSKYGGQGLFATDFIAKSSEFLIDPCLLAVQRPDSVSNTDLYEHISKYKDFEFEAMCQFNTLC